MEAYHIPVLLNSSIENLNIRPDGIYVDVTFGAGGHSKSILKQLSAEGHLYAFDQDEDAFANRLGDPRFTLIPANFRFLKRFLRLEGVKQIDGILADLGVSSHQLDVPERGFSYRFEAALDMRMGAGLEKSAALILNSYDEDMLVYIFSHYGEVRNSKRLAKAIVNARNHSELKNSTDLNRILDQNLMGHRAKYFSQVYQALRIEVNDEMNALKDLLKDGMSVMKKGGRFVVITYHSIEDRLVKNFFRSGNFEGEQMKDEFGNIERPFKLIHKKVIEADAEELRVNPRSRSAKMRVAEKI
ncbi:MAG: 16S rRNA (cytosine(1402)-N(4))-methyltransferase RsmH [Saprospiraceae bacterium]|nr:16S rRNA (cytosine(1402)-N(4))-methyltransferase RsmH [Saprospiraceae bacterium]